MVRGLWRCRPGPDDPEPSGRRKQLVRRAGPRRSLLVSRWRFTVALRSVLKDSPVWAALLDAWRHGAVVAGSSAGAMVLGDPMVDPRGGALTLGLGLVGHLAVLPHYDTWSPEKAHRTVQLATGHLRIAAVDERTALIRDPDGRWRAAGAGTGRGVRRRQAGGSWKSGLSITSGFAAGSPLPQRLHPLPLNASVAFPSTVRARKSRRRDPGSEGARTSKFRGQTSRAGLSLPRSVDARRPAAVGAFGLTMPLPGPVPLNASVARSVHSSRQEGLSARSRERSCPVRAGFTGQTSRAGLTLPRSVDARRPAAVGAFG